MTLRAGLLPLLAALALAGCGGTPDPAPPATAVPQVKLTAAELAFVRQARMVSPKIVGSDERLADRGANTCSSLTEPSKTHAWVIDQAVARFSSGSYAVSRAEAEQLVEAARTTVCST